MPIGRSTADAKGPEYVESRAPGAVVSNHSRLPLSVAYDGGLGTVQSCILAPPSCEELLLEMCKEFDSEPSA